MKKLENNQKIFLITILMTAISLIITGFVMFQLLSNEVSNNKVTLFSDETLENVYIYKNDDSKIYFIYNNEKYIIKGKTKEKYIGLADVVIENQKVKKIYAKSDFVEGVVERYSPEGVWLTDGQYYEMESACVLYETVGNKCNQIKYSDLIVGTTKVKLFLQNNHVCAMVKDQEAQLEDIHVLIKNNNNIFYQNIWISSKTNYVINNVSYNANEKSNLIEIMKNEQLEEVFVTSDSNYIQLHGESASHATKEYYGSFIVRAIAGGYVLINKIPIEDYIRYVLPSEMPVSFDEEALKAQAVCARTFAYSQLKNDTYALYGANLDDSTDFQVYNSDGCDKKTDEAVYDTTGQILSMDGKLIVCYYHSTSPGVTADFSVWGSQSPRYIKSVNQLDAIGEDFSNEESFSSMILQTLYCYESDSPFYRWKANVTLGDIVDPEYGRFVRLEIKERSQAGYVTRLVVDFENGSREYQNENQIRQLLGKGLSSITLQDGTIRNNFSMIPSSCFMIEEINANEVCIVGGGFGHGIGMSQYGANGMAKANKSYQEILEYYYNDVELTDISKIRY